MRNIEQMAREEAAIARAALKSRLRLLIGWVGLGLGLWGWFRFAGGQMGEGALLVMISLVLLGFSWGAGRVFRPSFASFAAGVIPLGFTFVLYFLTRLPSFYWGKDPDFWLSVHAGAVNEPLWSPLGYLLGQAVCHLVPTAQYVLLPVLSAAVLALALYFMGQEFFLQLKNKTPLNMFWIFLACAVVVVTPSFWREGTLASGLAASFGFLLYFFHRTLLSLEERPWRGIYFILGLLFTVHPLWGFLGLLYHLGSMDREGRKISRYLLFFITGLTPFLWIIFRAGRFFPSWGGDHPFWELLSHWELLLPSMAPAGYLQSTWKVLGWTTVLLGVFTLVLWFLNFFNWKAGWKIQFSSLDFWIGALAGLGGILYFSPSMETPGPTALWFIAGLGWTVLKLMEKGTEKKQSTFFSGGILAWIGAGCLLLTVGVPWIPGLGTQLGHPYFPQQHAMNLLETLGPKSILVCQDPFDAVACREARLMDPVAMDAVILDVQYLDQRWYLSQVIQSFPEVLFSDLTGSKEGLLKTLIMNNRDLWEIYWDTPVLPPEWEGPPAVPTVLAQEFEGPAADFVDPDKAQYHFDLGALPEGDQATGGASGVYFSRYVLGFNELGKYLLGKGRYPAAIHAFERSVKLDLAFREPQTYLAQMFSKENILEAARLQFENTIKSHPLKISGLMKELEEAQKANDDGKTVSLLDQMIHLNADLADAEYQLSKIYEKEGRIQESKTMLESSIAMNPQQLEAQMAMGRLMARMGNRIKAESAFRAVLEIDPQNKEAQVEMWKLLNKP